MLRITKKKKKKTKIENKLIYEKVFLPCSGMLSHGAPVSVAKPSIHLPATKASYDP